MAKSISINFKIRYPIVLYIYIYTYKCTFHPTSARFIQPIEYYITFSFKNWFWNCRLASCMHTSDWKWNWNTIRSCVVVVADITYLGYMTYDYDVCRSMYILTFLVVLCIAHVNLSNNSFPLQSISTVKFKLWIANKMNRKMFVWIEFVEKVLIAYWLILIFLKVCNKTQRKMKTIKMFKKKKKCRFFFIVIRWASMLNNNELQISIRFTSSHMVCAHRKKNNLKFLTCPRDGYGWRHNAYVIHIAKEQRMKKLDS